MFFGRDSDFAVIRRKIKDGLIVLCGTRRCGKTSMLWQIDRGRGQLGPEYVSVMVDMQKITVKDDRDFLIKLAQLILDGIAAPELSREESPPRLAGNPFEDFRNFCRRIKSFLGSRQLVLLFDEYEIFEMHVQAGHISLEMFQLFADWIYGIRGAFMIFTGSEKLEERDRKVWAPLLAKAGTAKRIGFLEKEDAFQLITEPLRGVVEYESGVPERIYELTAGQPFYTQKFCQELVDHLNEEHRWDITHESLERVIDQVVENPLPAMIFDWNSLTSLQKVVLAIAGDLNRTGRVAFDSFAIVDRSRDEGFGYHLNRNATNTALNDLCRMDLLNLESEGRYSFKMDLWRRWISRMHPVSQAIAEVSDSESGFGTGFTRVVRIGPREVPLSLLLLTGGVPLLAVLVAAYFLILQPAGRDLEALPMQDAPTALVSVETDPPGAEVHLGSLLLGRSPTPMRPVAVDTAELVMELNGYKTRTDTLRLAAGDTLSLAYGLTRRIGNLFISSNPPDAAIIVNGTDTGLKTPDTLFALAVNETHEVRVDREGYEPGSLGVVPIVEDQTFAREVTLTRRTYLTQIDSEPPGASIELDGRELGTTPVRWQLEYGAHELVARLDRYYEERRKVSIPVPEDRIALTLDRIPLGTLRLIADPFGEYWVDDEPLGSGASREREVEPGSHRVRVWHQTCLDTVFNVDVPSGDVLEIRLHCSRDTKRWTRLSP